MKKEIRRLNLEVFALRSQCVAAGLTPFAHSAAANLRYRLVKNQDLRDALRYQLEAHGVQVQSNRNGGTRNLRRSAAHRSRRSTKRQVNVAIRIEDSSASSKKDISKKISFSHPGKHWESVPSIYEPLSGGRAYLTRSALKQQSKKQ